MRHVAKARGARAPEATVGARTRTEHSPRIPRTFIDGPRVHVRHDSRRWQPRCSAHVVGVPHLLDANTVTTVMLYAVADSEADVAVFAKVEVGSVGQLTLIEEELAIVAVPLHQI